MFNGLDFRVPYSSEYSSEVQNSPVKCSGVLSSPTVTSISNSIAQEGELALEDDGSVCDDIFLMGQVRKREKEYLLGLLTQKSLYLNTG